MWRDEVRASHLGPLIEVLVRSNRIHPFFLSILAATNSFHLPIKYPIPLVLQCAFVHWCWAASAGGRCFSTLPWHQALAIAAGCSAELEPVECRSVLSTIFQRLIAYRLWRIHVFSNHSIGHLTCDSASHKSFGYIAFFKNNTFFLFWLISALLWCNLR